MATGGVGLKVGLIAENLRDLYVYPGTKTKLWDTRGPEAILHAAGGTITDLQGQPPTYTSTHLANLKGLCVTNGPIHSAVVEKLKTLFPDGANDG